MNTTDNVVGGTGFVWFLIIIICHNLSIIGFTIVYIHLVAAILIPWLLISIIFVMMYRPAPLAIKRIEAPLSSKLISHISEMVSGASTLQAYPAANEQFIKDLFARIDSLNQVHLTSFAVHAWLSIRSACISALFYFTIGLIGLRLRRSVLPGILSSLLISTLDLMWNNQKLLDTLAELQRGTNCVERLNYYATSTEQERAARLPAARKDWPMKGTIEFHGVSLRYRDELPLALRDVSISIAGGEKIGVVGRTAEGKSTMYCLLLGFLNACEGLISIDRLDINKVGLHDLRKRLRLSLRILHYLLGPLDRTWIHWKSCRRSF